MSQSPEKDGSAMEKALAQDGQGLLSHRQRKKIGT